MLHIAFDELPRGGAQEMFARSAGLDIVERHHVLKLVAKAIRAARLVKRRRPHTRQASVW